MAHTEEIYLLSSSFLLLINTISIGMMITDFDLTPIIINDNNHMVEKLRTI
ncbi:hypothetical protein [Ornithinibacillus bavariensis]|uniref:hypothetical protein n=1 Tax=Ornithinibacillus bavariensis TaxID=545502 RepID=UPI003D19C930